MRKLFVDRVERLTRFESIRVHLELSPSESIFSSHFPARPILPASALIEAFGQAATILLETSLGYTKKALPVFIRDAKFRQPIIPPCSVAIAMDVQQLTEEGALLSGRASQGNEVSAMCTMGIAYAPLEHYYGTESAAGYRQMYADLLNGADVHGFEWSPLAVLQDALRV